MAVFVHIHTRDAFHREEHGDGKAAGIIDVPGWGKCKVTFRPTAIKGDEYKVTHRSGISSFGSTPEAAAADMAAMHPPKGAIIPNVIKTGKARDAGKVYTLTWEIEGKEHSVDSNDLARLKAKLQDFRRNSKVDSAELYDNDNNRAIDHK